MIASSCHNSYSAVILLTPSIQYVLGSDIRTPDDKNNGSPEDDNNDSSPRDGNNEEDGEDRDTDPGGNLVAKERGGDEEDPADVDERGVEEDREDPSDIDEREGIRRIEDVPLDGIDNSSETEDIDKGDIADPQTICLGYYQQQNGIKEIEDNTGALTLKKISANTRELIPGGLFRITPNPYGLDSPLIVSDDGNTENFDCSPVDDGKIVLGQVPFSSYNIQEIQHPSIDFLVIHEADISIHENLANPIINFIERSFTFPSSTAMAVDNNRLRTIPNQYIINLKDNAEEGKLVAEEFANRGAEIIQVYEDSSVFRGFTINVNKNRELLNEMTNDSRVNYIEQDKMGQLASMTGNSMPSTDTNRIYETIPKGIDRIDSDLNGIFFEVNNTRNSVKNQNIYGNDNGYGNINGGISGNQINPQDVDVDIAILDTGVSFAHPDLNVYQGASFINGVKTADDDNGHGSHIAGTAAGKNNSLGVIGTAPGARLWAIKVCDRLGNCPVSSQIKGVEYITEHSDEIDVVNISIENPISLALDRTINQSIAKGIVYIAAAGNSGNNASLFSPASNPSVITVSAIVDSDGKCGGVGRPTFVGADDSFAIFSNFGDAIDIAAPGVDILSTYNGTEYGVNSGTSTAAPHVAGAAALYKATHQAALPSEVYNGLIMSGSSSLTKCDGNGHGYFNGDVDEFDEPLLYINNNDS